MPSPKCPPAAPDDARRATGAHIPPPSAEGHGSSTDLVASTPRPERWSFRIYLDGDAPSSRATAESLDQLCRSRLDDGCWSVEVVDVAVEPDAADAAGIKGVPVVIRDAPGPEVRVLGRLEASEWNAYVLGLPPSRTGGSADGGPPGS